VSGLTLGEWYPSNNYWQPENVIMFSKRHYEAIALVMQDSMPEAHWDPNKRAQWIVTRDRLAETFRRDNYLFKEERFKAACERGANVKARTRYVCV
jgi:hypothetical protein